LQDEASSTLKCMKLRDGGFEEVFMTKVDFPVTPESKNRSVYIRAKSIRVVWRNTNQDWHVESSGLSVLDREALFIGISIENAFRTVDIGPDAESKIEALRFRNFWGDKSELKNERIAESTGSLIKMIQSGNVLKAYEDLSKCLRQIKGIPTMKVMIQLEGSGNWPMDDLAIEKTKTAFLLQIAENLQNVKGVPCTATEDNVDVFMGSYAFRLRISHERGLSLVKREVPDKMLFIRSQHASMINGLQSRFPIYAPVARLAKRWVSAHLFSGCLAEEAIELLVAHVFLTPLPLGVPCSRINGFLRFLRLLAEPEELKKKIMVDFEPTKCFMSGLQAKFGTLKPWYDHIGGDAIGLTWTKHNSKKRERDEDEVETKPIEMLKAVGKMGKGLVRDIYLLKPPRFL
ncbi:hypothetical protein HID58_078763, partial [Brassica napus]